MTNSEFNGIDYTKIKIIISCRGADSLNLDEIEDFQGKLKSRSKKDVDKVVRSIVDFGFSFPFFIWVNDGYNFCLDGHGRILALKEMRKRGTVLPDFPVAYISARDEAEAKQKLLRLNSEYGEMTMDSVMEFAGGMELNGDELALSNVDLVDIDEKQTTEEKAEETGVEIDKPYKRVNVLLSMDPDAFLQNSDKFKDLKKCEGVEYVQSEN